MRDRIPALALLFASLCAALLPARGEFGASVGGPVSPEGTPAQVALPVAMHMKNTGGNDLAPNRWGVPTNPGRVPGKGSGLCVFTSIEMDARWQNVPELDGLQKWMTMRPGGGHPAKVDAVLKAFCASKGVPVPPYVQVESRNLEILRLAMKTGRPCAITQGYLPGYRGRIAHMVCLAHAGKPGESWGILDNNYPGRWAWMSEAEFSKSYAAFGNGWAVILLSPGPPPAPKE